MTTWDDEQAEMLNRRYEGRWHVWFVRTLYAGTTWHARPAGTEVATVNADSPEELVSAIAEHETSLLGGQLRHGGRRSPGPTQAGRPVDM